MLSRNHMTLAGRNPDFWRPDQIALSAGCKTSTKCRTAIVAGYQGAQREKED